MNKIIISIILASCSLALAEPTTYRVNCLSSMSELAFGINDSKIGNQKFKPGSELHINTTDRLGKSLGLEKPGYYTWDGEVIFYDTFSPVRRGQPQGTAKAIWTLNQFNKDQDGRITSYSKVGAEKISPRDLKSIQSLYIELSMSSLPEKVEALKKNGAANKDAKVLMLDKIYAACADVTDVKLQDGKTVAETSEKGRTLLRKEFPKSFAGGDSNAISKDSAGSR